MTKWSGHSLCYWPVKLALMKNAQRKRTSSCTWDWKTQVFLRLRKTQESNTQFFTGSPILTIYDLRVELDEEKTFAGTPSNNTLPLGPAIKNPKTSGSGTTCRRHESCWRDLLSLSEAVFPFNQEIPQALPIFFKESKMLELLQLHP